MISSLAAFLGLLQSIFLTLIKFRSSFHCDSAYLTACSSSCSRVLTSDFSVIWGVPISIYSTAFFLVVFGLSLALLWRPRRFARVIRPLLLVFAATALVFVLLLALYAVFYIGGLCHYCVVVYGLTVTIAIGVSLMQDGSYRESFHQLATWGVLRSATLRNAFLSLVAAISVQQLAYRSAARSSSGDARCVVHGRLPTTSIETDGTPKRARVALFLDMSCEHCKREYIELLDYSERQPGELQLAVFHFARSGECIPSDSGKINSYSESTQSCQAARAAVCAEQLSPGTGVEMVRQLFLLQESPSLSFADRNRIAEAARTAGVHGIPDDLSSAGAGSSPFFNCLDNNQQALNEILLHASFAIRKGILETPTMYITPYDDDGQPLPVMYQVKGVKDKGVAAILQEAEKTIHDSPTGESS